MTRLYRITSPPVMAIKAVVFQRAILAFFCLAALASCTVLPGMGPRSSAFGEAQWRYIPATNDDGELDRLPFVLVDVDGKIADFLSVTGDAGYFMGSFTAHDPPVSAPLGAGDTVRVTIFEAGPGGLFALGDGGGNGGNYITLPDQEVDNTGHISIPYADKGGDGGLVMVSGRRPAEVQHDIQQRLMNKAIEPQVIVTLVKRVSNLYSVMGEVNTPGRFSLDQGGIRIIDALSAAGGSRNNDYNTLITLQRGATSATSRLSALLAKPENNVFVQPSDLIAVKKDERYYNVLGATKSNSRVAFDAENVTVADALARAGGLDGNIAEPDAVVVLRREDPQTLERMGIKLEGLNDSEPLPTVYRFNFNEPSGMFLAQKMRLRNNDVVYVSNHSFNDVTKLFGVLRDMLLLKLISD